MSTDPSRCLRITHTSMTPTAVSSRYRSPTWFISALRPRPRCPALAEHSVLHADDHSWVIACRGRPSRVNSRRWRTARVARRSPPTSMQARPPQSLLLRGLVRAMPRFRGRYSEPITITSKGASASACSSPEGAGIQASCRTGVGCLSLSGPPAHRPIRKDESVARAASMRCRRVGGPGSARCSSRTGESPSSRSAHHAIWARSTRPTGGRDEHAGPCPAAVRDDSLAVALSSRTPPGLVVSGSEGCRAG